MNITPRQTETSHHVQAKFVTIHHTCIQCSNCPNSTKTQGPCDDEQPTATIYYTDVWVLKFEHQRKCVWPVFTRIQRKQNDIIEKRELKKTSFIDMAGLTV